MGRSEAVSPQLGTTAVKAVIHLGLERENIQRQRLAKGYKFSGLLESQEAGNKGGSAGQLLVAFNDC